MKKLSLFQLVTTLMLIFGVSVTFAAAAPKRFVTKNYTQYQSNAKVKNAWSPFPTGAGSTNSPTERAVPWVGLKLLCGIMASTCGAEIYMKTDTDKPVFVGEGIMDLSTGVITPNLIVNNGFRLTSNEPGVIEIREDS